MSEPVLLFAFGMLSLVVGVAFRLGKRRGAARWYFDENSPWYIRNFVFGVIPGAAFWLFGSAALAMLDRAPEWLTWSAVAASLASGLVAFAFTYHPPEMMKPQWLRKEEMTRRRPVRGPESREGAWMVIDRLALAILMAVVGTALAAAMVMITFEAIS